MKDNYDFTNAKRATEVEPLNRLRASKTRISIMIDDEVLEAFRDRGEARGIGYQTLINQVLRDYLEQTPLTEDRVRQVIREELEKSKNS